MFQPSVYQLAIFEWIKTGSGNGIVNAVAGSGKTTTLVEAAKVLEGSGLFMAFNKSIAEELGRRLVGTQMTATNTHKIGMAACRSLNARAKVVYTKWQYITEEILRAKGITNKRALYNSRRKLESLCSKVMVTLTDPADLEAVEDIAEHFGIEADALIISSVAQAIETAGKEFKATGALSFDEMLYWPVKWNASFPQYPWVFVDECQDLNAVQFEIALRSVKPGGRMLFVGDKNQAIYGFAGADHRSFDTIQTRTNAVALPLSICYRCPAGHLDLVKSIVPQIEQRPDAPQGTIEYVGSFDNYAEKASMVGAMVMCRKTAPLIKACFVMIENRIPVIVLGRAIGQGLVSLLDKISEVPGFTYENIVRHIGEYGRKEIAKLSQKESNEAKIDELQDKLDCLESCAMNFDECKSVECLKDEIEKLFGELDDQKKPINPKSVVLLLTVHRAKGLESDRTFILSPEDLPLKRKNQMEWELQQEYNLKYVALTRSTNYMGVFGSEGIFTQEQPLSVDVSNDALMEMLGDGLRDLIDKHQPEIIDATGRDAADLRDAGYPVVTTIGVEPLKLLPALVASSETHPLLSPKVTTPEPVPAIAEAVKVEIVMSEPEIAAQPVLSGFEPEPKVPRIVTISDARLAIGLMLDKVTEMEKLQEVLELLEKIS